MRIGQDTILLVGKLGGGTGGVRGRGKKVKCNKDECFLNKNWGNKVV